MDGVLPICARRRFHADDDVEAAGEPEHNYDNVSVPIRLKDRCAPVAYLFQWKRRPLLQKNEILA